MTATTQFAAWVDRSAQLQISLQAKIVEMVPIVNEGLLFALAHNILELKVAPLFLVKLGQRMPLEAIPRIWSKHKELLHTSVDGLCELVTPLPCARC